MLSSDKIHVSLVGAWRLMLGKADGIRMLDLSVDGFWDSFFAIVVAAPALIVSWVGIANEIGDPDAFAGRFGLLVRLALVDIGTWLLPLAVFALVAPYAGLGKRFVPYVVATNWASAIFAWMMLPAALLGLFLPITDKFVLSVSLLLFLIVQVFTWRLTNAVIGKGGAIATAVFAGMLIGSQVLLFALQELLGISLPG